VAQPGTQKGREIDISHEVSPPTFPEFGDWPPPPELSLAISAGHGRTIANQGPSAKTRNTLFFRGKP
jgi:hypothetical protein